QTFEGSRTGPGASDTEIELGSQLTLLRVGALEARAQDWILGSRPRPPLNTARCLQPRDGRHGRGTSGSMQRRERLPVLVVRALLGDCWVSRGTADDD